MTDHARIGPTAHYTAYVWKRLGFPYADLFATPKGAALYWGIFAAGEWATRVIPRVPTMTEYLEYRHRLVEAVVEAHDPDLVVELGAGLSRRGLTWAVDRGVRAIDVDLPAMIAGKTEALARAPAEVRRAARQRYTTEAADVLAEGFGARLRQWIGSARRPVIVAEGLLSYFARDDRDRLLAAVGACIPAQGLLVCDLHTRTAQAEAAASIAVLRTAIRTLTRRRQALDPYPDLAAVQSAFAAAGLRAHVAEAAAHVDRQPRLARLFSPAQVVAAVPMVQSS